MNDIITDTLIIGCGIAGATAALRLSDDPNHHITIITRAPDPADSNSTWAQGGIVTRGLDDSPELLIEDILRAGAGLSDARAARILAEEGPRLVQSVLVEGCGVRFDEAENGAFIYGLEAAHSTRRVVHVGDKTGKAIVNGLLKTLAQRPNIALLTDHTAVDLIADDPQNACLGAVVLERETGAIMRVLAGQTILATGGIGQIYGSTTNPQGARGDGIAMAWRAGAQITNAEYVQFHPTAMHVNGDQNLLVSEAVRGEGAILLTPDGERFMRHYDAEWLELAPRDVVARAIHHEMQAHGYAHVLLDIASQRSPAFIRDRFPQLVENCQKLGFDPLSEPIPVLPAAHYFCGGVQVDGWGRTDFDRLYAVGEVSCTGLHGANRLASTSLLEGLVWGDRAARHILRAGRDSITAAGAISWQHDGRALPDSDWIDDTLHTLKDIMWRDVGLVRSGQDLARARRELSQLQGQVEQTYRDSRLSDALIGLRNAIQTATLITEAAIQNRHSQGAHFRADTISEMAQPITSLSP